ncbi:MAG: hypothetical protein L6R42_004867, partial [Xanthoria sp. 1 TBL-2021]
VKNGLGRHIGTVHPADLAIEGQAIYASELIWGASIPIIKLSILLLYIRIFGRLRYFKNLAYIIGTFSVCWGYSCWDLSKLHPFRSREDKKPKTSRTYIISLVRFVQLITNANPEATWSLGIFSTWTTAKPNLGIVSACLRTMKPLLRRFLPRSKTPVAKGSTQCGSLAPKKVPLVTESFESSGFNKLKGGRGQFRELDDDVMEHVPDIPGTQTHISSTEVGRDRSGIPLNVIEVKTNMDWQNVSREDLPR